MVRGFSITSHTTKALKVLREKVAEKLQPLCVSVLETDQAGREQLEQAVTAIVAALADRDPDRLRADIRSLRVERDQLLVHLRDVERLLLEARRADYLPVSIGGKTCTPGEAAREVASGAHAHGWIPGPVEAGAPLPLSVTAINDLYATNVAVTIDAEQELIESIPASDELLQPDEFMQVVAGLVSDQSAVFDAYWSSPASPDDSIDYETLGEAAIRAMAPLTNDSGWEIAIVAAGRRKEGAAAPWIELIRSIETTTATAAGIQETLIRSDPHLADDISLTDSLRLATEIAAHVRQKGHVGRLQKLWQADWRHFIAKARSRNTEPDTLEDFEALAAYTKLLIQRKSLVDRWDRLMAPLGAPTCAELGPEPEITCEQYVPGIQQALDWTARMWEPACAALEAANFDWEQFIGDQSADLRQYGDLLRIRDSVLGPLQQCLAVRQAAVRHEKSMIVLEALENALAGFVGATTTNLKKAVKLRDPDAYAIAFNRFEDLRARDAVLRSRLAWLKAVDTSAPNWAQHIRSRDGKHGAPLPPGDPNRAWRWQQLSQELDRRALIDTVRLTREREELRGRIRHVTVDLIEAQSWLHQIERTASDERRALVGWADTMRRIGRGNAAGHQSCELRLAN